MDSLKTVKIKIVLRMNGTLILLIYLDSPGSNNLSLVLYQWKINSRVGFRN